MITKYQIFSVSSVAPINYEFHHFIFQLKDDDNDTQVLLDQLASCNDDKHLVSLFSYLEGPWAFIYWQVIILFYTQLKFLSS